jgi:ribosome-associated toxin RatA of RatAB toxin-antitoxin module
MLIKYDVTIRTTAKELFELTQNYARRTEWNPLTTEAYLINADIPAEGELVRCTARNGMSMDTVYVSYQPYKVAAVKLVEGPYIFDKFAGGWRFDEVGPGQTNVRFSYNVSAKPKWLSWILTPIVVAVFKRETRKRIRALQAHAEREHFNTSLRVRH